MFEIFFTLEKNKSLVKLSTIEYELQKLTLKSFDILINKYDCLIKLMFQKKLLNFKEIKQKKIIIKLLLFGYKKLKELDNINNFDIEKMKNILNTIHYEINTNKKNFTSKEFNDFLADEWNNSDNENDLVINNKTNKKIKIINSDNSDNSDKTQKK